MTEPEYITNPKLCRDCRWAVNTMPDYKPSGPEARSLGLADYAWRCEHSSATRPPGPPSPVTGARAPAWQMSCPEARGYGHMAPCGPEGRFWEPIEVGFGELDV